MTRTHSFYTLAFMTPIDVDTPILNMVSLNE